MAERSTVAWILLSVVDDDDIYKTICDHLPATTIVLSTDLQEPTFNSTDLRDHLRVTTINFNTVSGKRENNGVEVQLWLLAPSTASRLRHRQDQRRDQRGPVASFRVFF
nr:uncharacterized protein LOC109158733 [Ipomoea trifida]